MMIIEKHSYYEYSIEYETNSDESGYIYAIYDSYYKPSLDTVIRESEEWFETEQEARFAAIGHIELLESGEG